MLPASFPRRGDGEMCLYGQLRIEQTLPTPLSMRRLASDTQTHNLPTRFPSKVLDRLHYMLSTNLGLLQANQRWQLESSASPDVG